MIVRKAIDDLIDYERNARMHDEDQLAELMRSIEEFGFNDCPEVGSDNVIISGHARVEAAKRLGMKEIPVIVLEHLSDPIKRLGYVHAANRIAMNASWNFDQLRDDFITMRENDFDATLAGWETEEIEDFLNPEELNEGLVDPDDCGDVPEEPICRLGDVWILGNHRLICGDSRSADDVGKLFAGVTPVLMVTDPPYGVNYDPEWREDADLGIGKRSKGKVINDEIIDWSETYSLFPGDVVYVWHAGKYTHIVARNLEDCGFQIVSQIIWAKQHFALSRGDYHWQHEPCWYAVRNGKRHNWRGKRDQSTLWEISNNNAFGGKKEETHGHGTQKPVQCMQRPIENNTRPNDYVYDPFGGSGTTLIACEQIGRRCLMIELSEQYCDVIIKRWQKFTGKKAILESDGSYFDEK